METLQNEKKTSQTTETIQHIDKIIILKIKCTLFNTVIVDAISYILVSIYLQRTLGWQLAISNKTGQQAVVTV